jgi:dehydrogenase/reductase SDR family protein 7B
MNFNGKTIWITGASSGIGKAVALELSKEKAHLILSGRNENALNEVGILCKKNGSSIAVVPFDLGNEKSVEAAAKKVMDKGVKIDALYQFGGISHRSFVSETPLFVDRKILEVNFFGTVALTKAVLPGMIKDRSGHLAVTTSLVGKFGFPYRSAYSAAKQALHGFFESLRAENVKNNIAVSIIIPGRIKTNVSLNSLDKEGNPRLVTDESLANGMSVEKAAKKIIRQLGKQKKEIPVGGKEMVMLPIRRFLPRLFYYMAARVKPL